jgi:hypothetical protein
MVRLVQKDTIHRTSTILSRISIKAIGCLGSSEKAHQTLILDGSLLYSRIISLDTRKRPYHGRKCKKNAIITGDLTFPTTLGDGKVLRNK